MATSIGRPPSSAEAAEAGKSRAAKARATGIERFMANILHLARAGHD
jgi:hypothetical protein